MLLGKLGLSVNKSYTFVREVVSSGNIISDWVMMHVSSLFLQFCCAHTTTIKFLNLESSFDMKNRHELTAGDTV